MRTGDSSFLKTQRGSRSSAVASAKATMTKIRTTTVRIVGLVLPDLDLVGDCDHAGEVRNIFARGRPLRCVPDVAGQRHLAE